MKSIEYITPTLQHSIPPSLRSAPPAVRVVAAPRWHHAIGTAALFLWTAYWAIMAVLTIWQVWVNAPSPHVAWLASLGTLSTTFLQWAPIAALLAITWVLVDLALSFVAVTLLDEEGPL